MDSFEFCSIYYSTLPKDAPAKFYLSTTFGLSFMISSVAATQSSTFYAYLITKIGTGALSRTTGDKQVPEGLTESITI